MKKLKIMFASMAFLFAVVAAFASKNVSSDDALVDYYRQSGTNCVIETFCHPLNPGTLCDYTVYQVKNGNQCQNSIMAFKP